MVKHLKQTHAITSGGRIADRWRLIPPKKAWSCGFCIRLSPSQEDPPNHIGIHIFGRGQSISDRDSTKAIQDLLLPPEIREASNIFETHLIRSAVPRSIGKNLNAMTYNTSSKKDLHAKISHTRLLGRHTIVPNDWSPDQHEEMAYATTMSTIPTLHINKGLSRPFGHHAATSSETLLQCDQDQRRNTNPLRYLELHQPLKLRVILEQQYTSSRQLSLQLSTTARMAAEDIGY